MAEHDLITDIIDINAPLTHPTNEMGNTADPSLPLHISVQAFGSPAASAWLERTARNSGSNREGRRGWNDFPMRVAGRDVVVKHGPPFVNNRGYGSSLQMTMRESLPYARLVFINLVPADWEQDFRNAIVKSSPLVSAVFIGVFQTQSKPESSTEVQAQRSERLRTLAVSKGHTYFKVALDDIEAHMNEYLSAGVADAVAAVDDYNARVASTARGVAAGKAKRRSWNAVYATLFNVLYDLFQIVLATTDMVTDALVAKQFYDDGHLQFFWIAVVDLIIAQICYAAFFVTLYSHRQSWANKILVWLVVLPFGPLIPLIIFIVSLRPPCLIKAFAATGILDPDYNDYTAEGEDPVSVALRKKMVAHLGFNLESIVEAIPQSILQLVAIVVTQQVTAVSVFSITCSIISVASKCLMMSYSIHRPTLFFQFFCYVYDIFSIFAVASWLFYESPTTAMLDPMAVPFYHHTRDIFTAIWFWKEAIFLPISFVMLTMMFVTQIIRVWNMHFLQPVERRSQYFEYTLWYIGASMIFLPVNILMDGLKFSLLPLFVGDVNRSNYKGKRNYYLFVFHFLHGSDLNTKSYVVNSLHSEERLRLVPNPHYYNDPNMERYDIANRLKHDVATQVASAPLTTYNADEIMTRMGKTFSGAMKELRDDIIRNGWPPGVNRTISHIRTYLFFGLMFPPWVLSNIYSCLYPFLRLGSIGAAETASAQRFFTYCLIILAILLLLLFPSAARFKLGEARALIFDPETPTDAHIYVIKKRYARIKEWQAGREQTQGPQWAERHAAPDEGRSLFDASDMESRL